MKNVIYYFTGTGNSLSIARQLKGLLNESGECRPIDGSADIEMDQDVKTLGVVFPIYAYRPPHRVLNFLKKLKGKNLSYIYTLSTCGGGVGDLFPFLKRTIGKNCYRGGFTIQMPFNFFPMGDAGDSKEQQRRFNHAQEKLTTIVEKIEGRETYYEPIQSLKKAYIHPGILYKLVYPMIPKMDKNFHVNESCTSCGSCANLCLNRNIEINEGKPQWQSHCEQCWACFHWCPQSAIESGKVTQGKVRYHHPDISRKDLKTLRIPKGIV